MKFLMGLLAALFMVGTAQAGLKSPMVQDAEDTKGHFWNLTVGTEMTFDSTFHTDAGDVKGNVMTVKIKTVAGHLCTVEASAGGNTVENVMGTDGDYYCWGLVEDGKFTATMRMFKYGAKVGDTWSGWVKQAEGAPNVTLKYVANEEVVVPAGTYKDVIHIQAVVDGGPTLDYYFAAKVGMIKYTITHDGKVVKTLEMATIKSAK